MLPDGRSAVTEASGRRLAAIMFTDVVGYTSLTEQDEARALRVRDRHRAILRPLVEQCEGELLETPGDESLSVFASARRAVDCALAVQAALREDPELRLRIGIHLGDVLRRDGELIGEGVNVAARIRPLAEPGGVCVSAAVWNQVRSGASVSARSLGAHRLKNVSEPLEVYALVPARTLPKRPLWRRWPARIAAGFALLLGFGWWYRGPLITAAVLWAPKVLGSPIHQDLGFATASDGVRISYATSGKGPPVLYVVGWATHLENGIGSPLYDPADLIATTSRDHLMVRYDGRGFGLSDRDVSDFSLEARVRDIEAVADALQLERFAIWAVSSGGPAALAFTARHPERVACLVLASSMASSSHIPPELRERFERVLDLVDTDWTTPGVSRMFSSVMSKGRASDIWSDIGSEFMSRAGEGPAIAGYMREQLKIDATVEARAIRVPTLVIHARDDEVVELEAGRQLAALIPGARFELVNGGHGEGIGNSQETMNLVLAFLEEASW
jgi:class 3 adenylate cyclase/pimeloyl-ACP methyl ester carboxylesterase